MSEDDSLSLGNACGIGEGHLRGADQRDVAGHGKRRVEREKSAISAAIEVVLENTGGVHGDAARRHLVVISVVKSEDELRSAVGVIEPAEADSQLPLADDT